MRYLGGKFHIAKKLAEFLESHRKPGQLYIEPFCGAMNVFCKMAGPKEAYDAHSELIALWQAARDGWEPPAEMSREEWQRIKGDPGEDPKLRAFAGFGCSFGGVYFAGYANSGQRNYALNARNSIMRKTRLLSGSTIECKQYQDISPSGALIYCDPPYTGTAGYKGTGSFDHNEFWTTMREWSKSNAVFISEMSAPDDFDVVLEIPKSRSVMRRGKHEIVMEKVYKWRQSS